MPMPLKVSDGLLAAARQEAAAAERSITAQVEHWARIGRAVEAIVAHRELLTLKKTGDLLTPVFPSKARRREVHQLLARVTAGEGRDMTKARIQAAGKPIYASAPDHPGMVVQVLPNGTRHLGRIHGRHFVPAGLDEQR